MCNRFPSFPEPQNSNSDLVATMLSVRRAGLLNGFGHHNLRPQIVRKLREDKGEVSQMSLYRTLAWCQILIGNMVPFEVKADFRRYQGHIEGWAKLV
jgi:hypothetical protein